MLKFYCRCRALAVSWGVDHAPILWQVRNLQIRKIEVIIEVKGENALNTLPAVYCWELGREVETSCILTLRLGALVHICFHGSSINNSFRLEFRKITSYSVQTV